ncbi:hypothetical protein KRR26_20980 [Corallococcus sp. M34]|uniref:hypothetical protein n=1 Tax=Citreicoccus inhibens TaxID=2849499 RepID=UPI001C22A8BE|nr:hypothetical protein [Citreicoccus inhibens]MBU8898095.1 hypothetical protein [Citreicoccus inhibens]
MSDKARWKLPLLAASVLLVAGVFVAVDTLRAPPGGAPVSPSEAARPRPSEPAPVPASAAVAPRAREGGPDLVAAAVAKLPEAPEESARTLVDLERLRARMPDNLYWEVGVPTKDPEVLRKRAEAERQWNVVFGKVQTGEATEEEIHRYFDYRRKLSEDSIAFAQGVLGEYGDSLPDQDQGLYELSIKMHTTRLQELPRQTDEALARREATAKRQREWRQRGGGN